MGYPHLSASLIWCSGSCVRVGKLACRNSVTASKIVVALHFGQARGGAAKGVGAVAFGIKPLGRGRGGTDQLHALVIKRVDQKHEAPGDVPLMRVECGNM